MHKREGINEVTAFKRNSFKVLENKMIEKGKEIKALIYEVDDMKKQVEAFKAEILRKKSKLLNLSY